MIQRSFIAGSRSLNEKDLHDNLTYFKVPPADIESIRSKLAFIIFDEYANILKDMYSTRFNGHPKNKGDHDRMDMMSLKINCASFLLIPTSSVEGRDTCMDLENFYVTPCFSHDYQVTLVEYMKQQNTQSVCTTRDKETDRDTHFQKRNDFPPKIKIKINTLLAGHRVGVPCYPVNRVLI